MRKGRQEGNARGMGGDDEEAALVMWNNETKREME